MFEKTLLQLTPTRHDECGVSNPYQFSVQQYRLNHTGRKSAKESWHTTTASILGRAIACNYTKTMHILIFVDSTWIKNKDISKYFISALRKGQKQWDHVWKGNKKVSCRREAARCSVSFLPRDSRHKRGLCCHYGLRKGDEYPAYALRSMALFYLYVL